ncbi:hypothetical protein L1887_18600 [Cichorium endivia]|nr:hypothetical protein L1887_18600 [Cichorium endivia]
MITASHFTSLRRNCSTKIKTDRLLPLGNKALVSSTSGRFIVSTSGSRKLHNFITREEIVDRSRWLDLVALPQRPRILWLREG